MVESPAEPGDHRVRNITRGVSLLSIQNVVTSVLAFVLLAVLLRFLPIEYGIYSAVLTVVGIAQAFSTFGLSLASTRYVAFLREKDEAESWAAASSTLVLSLGLSLVVTLIYAFLAPYFSLFFTSPKTLEWTGLFLLGGLWLFASSLALTVQGIIQGLKKYSLLAKMLLVSRFVMVAFTIVVLLEYDNITVPVVGWAIYYFLLIGWSLKIVAKDMFSHREKRYSYSTIIRYSFPLGVAGVIQAFAGNSDLLVVGGYLATTSLGIYNAAIQVTSVLGVVLVTPLLTAFFPEASSTADSELSNAFRLSVRFLMLSVLPASFVLAGLSPQLLTFFSGGGSYLGGVVPMELMAFFYVFYGLEAISIYLLQAVGRTTRAMVAGIASAGIVIGLSVLLVPELGLVGAALSRVAAVAAGLAVAIYYSRKYVRNLDNLEFYVKCVVCSAVPFAVSYLLTTFVSSMTVTLVPYALLSGFLFLFCLKVLGVLSEEDRRYLSDILPSFGQRVLKYI
ncbi:MAG: oligosaccharide flippase family protein [Nitrososphaerales archaeon]